MTAVYVEKRRGQSDNWLAVMDLPLQLRKSGLIKNHKGEPVARRFVRSTETTDKSLADAIARAYAVEWEAKIGAALGSIKAGFYQRKLAELFPTGAAPIRTMEPHDLSDGRTIWLDKDTGDLVKDDLVAVQSVNRNLRSGAKYASKVDSWIEYQSAEDGWTPKTADMKRSRVLYFAKSFPFVESITLAAVQAWVMKLRVTERLAIDTIKNKVTTNGQYWKHLKALGIAPAGPSPFNKDDLDMPTSKRDDDEELRKAFAANDVVKLYKSARDGYTQTVRDGKPCKPCQRAGSRTLADLIYIAAYTGGRIESLCSLKIEDIRFDASVPDEEGKPHIVSYFTIKRDKSKAGKRDVPIHKKLEPLLRRLIGKRKSGYVLADLKPGKYGRLSHTIGNDFSDLKIALGFGPSQTFHSFRRTVSTLLQNKKAHEATAANIIGHKIKSLTFGLYSDGASLPVKAKAIAKLRYPKELKP